MIWTLIAIIVSIGFLVSMGAVAFVIYDGIKKADEVIMNEA